MALGLTPYVRRRRTIWTRAAAWHVLGGVLGGFIVALALWSIAMPIRVLLDTWHSEIIVLVLLVAALGDARQLPTGTPRQVPPTWLQKYGLNNGFFLYGLALGLALTTKINNWLLYGVAVMIALSPTFAAAILLGISFGAARSAGVVLVSVRATRISLVWRRQGGPGSLRLFAAAVSITVALLFVLPMFDFQEF